MKKQKIILFLILFFTSLLFRGQVYANSVCTNRQVQSDNTIGSYRQINPTTIEVLFTNGRYLTIDFYGDNIFRLFQDNSGGLIRDPEAKPVAKILTDNPRKNVSKLSVYDDNDNISITTGKIAILLNKKSSFIKVIDVKKKATVFEQLESVSFEKGNTCLTLKEYPQEYFYGGGVQNGRFSHKGEKIAIENQNSWTDGGVASPTPFFWSTNGYAVMCYTFSKGKYDFGATEKGKVRLSHETPYLDLFVMIDNDPVALLGDYYQLTGNPILLPKFAFYEGHLNAYNRDYWKEDKNGVLFEDGKRYKESQKNNGGTKESLNGEKNNYQFSARAVIDRYKSHDMPLGWILPNDGYGAGYGQAKTLDGNVQNLKEFGDYARLNGVEIGLWTQSDLHPKANIDALLQRDIVKEVCDAGVRVLKTDVAWVGDGYSFGLNGVSDVAHTMSYYGSNARPFIISLDGWAGTQRYAGIWTGDQTGGEWEYIRFHIPTYIGSGLSGIPNITSDMDGIFGGMNPFVNTRDFQWKAFTPIQLNMDGWGTNEKYPHALGEPATSINRWYLKLKSQLIPYTYSIAKEAVDGMPLIRAMFFMSPNDYTHGLATQYQFMYGPNFLVAPIYQQTKCDVQGNDIRNGIYLPAGNWIDYFTGEKYRGGCIINNFSAPLWKLPLFIKAGSIIPMTNPNNHPSEINKSLRIYEIYPEGKSSFIEYDDDGVSEAYKSGKGVTTLIESVVANGTATITVYPTKGDFDGFKKVKTTEFIVNMTSYPKQVSATRGKTKIKLSETKSIAEFLKKGNVFYYNSAPDLNKFATKGSEFEKTLIKKNPQLLVKLTSTDITSSVTTLCIKGLTFSPANICRATGILIAPINAQVSEVNAKAYTLTPTWNKVTNADYYEILLNGSLYTTIKDNYLLFDGLDANTTYQFKLRAVNKNGVSPWTTFSAKTKSNPLQYAIQGLRGEVSAESQEGFELYHLFDFSETGDIWHTKYGVNALPYDLIIDQRSINTLDKFNYLPRIDGGNGTILKGIVYYSMDKKNWIKAGVFNWKCDGETKEFYFDNHPTARYIKLSITDGVGNYGSGRELYVFKVPQTVTILPGDINNDGKIDDNDLLSYTNYTGLHKGDPDFDGYIGNGDINKNGLIDAYDISNVTVQLEGGVQDNVSPKELAGKILIIADKKQYTKGDDVNILIKGIDLQTVNALSFSLPYNQQDFEFVGVQPLNMKSMENLTYDRLHKDGTKTLSPTFVNIGDKETLDGTMDLFILKLKAKQNIVFELKPTDILLVDKHLNTITNIQ